MTEMEYMRALIQKAGGDPDKLPDRLKSTFYECLMDCMSGGGSGGNSGEYTQPDWGMKEEVVYPEQEATFVSVAAAGGMVGTFATFEQDLVVGEIYLINYDGVIYERVYDGKRLGNNIIMGGVDTGEPFCIGLMQGFYAIAPVNQTPGKKVVGIKHKVVKAIDYAYIPTLTVNCVLDATNNNYTADKTTEEVKNAIKNGLRVIYQIDQGEGTTYTVEPNGIDGFGNIIAVLYECNSNNALRSVALAHKPDGRVYPIIAYVD